LCWDIIFIIIPTQKNNLETLFYNSEIKKEEIKMGFNLPTKQPTKTSKPIVLDAIDTEDQAPVEAPKKKVAKKPAKKKAEPKHESKKEATEQPNAFFHKLQITEPKDEKLSTNISDANLRKLERLIEAGCQNKSKAIGAILDAFDVEKAIEEPTFFVKNTITTDARHNRLNISMTPSQREKLMTVAHAGLGNIALAFSCILNAFDVEEALKNMEE
jgi:hypothetical protein